MPRTSRPTPCGRRSSERAAGRPTARRELVGLIEQGSTLRQAAACLSGAPATAHRWWHRWQDASEAQRAPFTDVFGQAGRRWLAEVELPVHEREQVDSNLRLHDALDVEVELVERQLAEQALARRDVRHLMTIPGVGAITALALVAVVGDVRRFPAPATWSGISGSIRGSVSQATRPPGTATSRVPGRRTLVARKAAAVEAADLVKERK